MTQQPLAITSQWQVTKKNASTILGCIERIITFKMCGIKILFCLSGKATQRSLFPVKHHTSKKWIMFRQSRGECWGLSRVFKNKTYGEKTEKIGVFSLEKRNLRRGCITVFKPWFLVLPQQKNSTDDFLLHCSCLLCINIATWQMQGF